ncbi:MAG: hypothetical protein IKF38_01835 [Clostridia bacterium]|nr:hypothetical protein [Clostridia bacterium]
MDFLMRYKKNQKTNKKMAEKGITLIALVITVIVLLILAGVSISAITGGDGVIENAKHAKDANENVEELESIKLAVVEAVERSRTDVIETQDLNNALEGLIEGEIQGTGPWTVVGKSGITYFISTDGEVSSFNGIIVNRERAKLIIGKTESVNLTAILSPNLEGKTIQWQIKGDNAGSLSLSSVEGSTTTVSLRDGAVAGKATVVAKTSDGSGEEGKCTITVVEGTTENPGSIVLTENPSSIVLTQNGSSVSPITLNIGESATAITGKVYSDQNNEMTELIVSFKSIDTTVATVTSGGVIAGVGEGSTTIIGYYDANANGDYDVGEVYASVGVTVNDPRADTEKYKPASSSEAVQSLNTLTGKSGTVTIKDAFDNSIPVPTGFGIAYESGSSIKDGIVIENVSTKDQFVWIPVGRFNTSKTTTESILLGRYETISSTAFPSQGQNGSYVDAKVMIGDCYYEYNSSFEFNAMAKNLSGFVNSALTNDGYYIARFEAGIAKSPHNYYASVKTPTSTKPLSQKSKCVWNGITQLDASTACQNMYSGVNSDLINSYAWDTALIFIEKCGTSGYASISGKSTHNSDPTHTGVGELSTTDAVDVQCNIYDMAGNVSEWTTESSNFKWTVGNGYMLSPCVRRGGWYATDAGAGERAFQANTDSLNSIAFRSVLYF